MGKYDRTKEPYYDNGERELLEKQYYQLMAVPGRVAQAREFSTMQTILRGIIKSIGDSIMHDGDIIEGCQVIVSPDKSFVTVTPGKIYMDGIVTPFNGVTNLPIKGEGEEILAVTLNDYIVTSNDDKELLDPSQGFNNYSKSGCDRIMRILDIIVLNDEDTARDSSISYAPIAYLRDGDLAVENYAPSYSAMEQTLARRTYDESGSYVVNGLSIHLENRDNNTDEYNIVVEPGKAYVLGYELKIPTARRIPNARSTKTSLISNIEDNYSYGKDVYYLDDEPYVKSIESLRGVVRVQEPHTGPNSNTGSTELLNESVTILYQNTHPIKVTSGTKGSDDYVEYSVGLSESDPTDCYIDRPGGSKWFIKWNGVNTPESGKSFNVEYNYNKNFVLDEDYELVVDSTGSYIRFLNVGSADDPFTQTPLSGTTFFVNYLQYLARRDVVYIDQYGKISVLEGIPAENGYESIPNAPVNTLTLAQIYNPPNGSVNATLAPLNINVNNVGLTRFTMNDIQKILDRVKKTEYNQMFLALNDDARNISTVYDKKGIITDPIIDLSRVDINYNRNSIGEKIDPNKSVYNMALDLNLSKAYLPLKVSNYNFGKKITDTAHQYSRLITLKPTKEIPVLEQPYSTGSFLVNPYTLYPQLPEVNITPAVDSWFDDTVVEIPVSLTNNTIVSTSTKYLYDTARRTQVKGGFFSAYTTTSTSTTSTNSDVAVGSSQETTSTESIVSERSVTYMRQIEVTIEGSHYSSNLDKIKCEFDGVPVKLTPVSEKYRGSEDGTLKSDDNGYVRGTFTIPEKVRTGVREVRLYSDSNIPGYVDDSYTLFQSSGIARDIQRTVTTVTTVLLQRTVTTTVNTLYTTYVDPVGQTFVLDKDTILKGVDVFFESKPTESNHSITLEIRNVVNGTIGSTIYASKTLSATQVSVSPDASVATRFDFSDPTVLEGNTEYAFVLRSVSDKYRVYVSELGGVAKETGDVILKNPYLTGVMMSSSNNSSWTVHQTSDIKFTLWEDVYESNGTIVYDNIPVNNITRLDLEADYVELDGTSVNWYYMLDGETAYKPITPGTLRNLPKEATALTIKVEMTSDNENLTPFIASDSMLIIGSSYELEGEYVGVGVEGIDPYKNVTLILNAYTPSQTRITPYFSPDNGTTKIELVMDPSKTRALNNNWSEIVYKGSIPKDGSSDKFRLFIEAESDVATRTPEFSAIRVSMD